MTMAAINEVTDLKTDGNIAVISVNSPPVNALSQNVREGLQEALNKALADPAVEGIVVRCEGRTFIAGADIREFGKPRNRRV
jgi:3-hydroxyacyl-CoA dehydrogenase